MPPPGSVSLISAPTPDRKEIIRRSQEQEQQASSSSENRNQSRSQSPKTVSFNLSKEEAAKPTPPQKTPPSDKKRQTEDYVMLGMLSPMGEVAHQKYQELLLETNATPGKVLQDMMARAAPDEISAVIELIHFLDA